MKKRAKKINNLEQTFKSGEVMSMLENMNDGIRVIGEDQQDIKKDVRYIKNDMDVIKSDVDAIKGNINLMKSDINVLKSDVAEIKFELKRKVYYDEFEKLEKRVVKLEKFGFAR
ncbi:MAG: hypothetical protein NTZ97_02195 [Candidatus Moranbacteria bacterium]|nr:hypothetical protein [Candidatus Moranbacteria bacterium]